MGGAYSIPDRQRRIRAPIPDLDAVVGSPIPELLDPVPPRETIDVLDSHQFDVSALERYLGARMVDVRPPFLVRQFRGGQSNPTYYVEASAQRLVLRRKPPGQLLPSAHAIEREYRVMRALEGSGVPVPKTCLLCEDPDVIGTPFFVMEYVDSHPMTDAALPIACPANGGRFIAR
jgi:aminoglycoside phosphotransferase (APT) family kinase protein